MSIFPPEVVEAVLRMAWIHETGHLQLQVELFNPLTKELYAMASVPHRPTSTAVQALEQALLELRSLWLEVTDPEPF